MEIALDRGWTIYAETAVEGSATRIEILSDGGLKQGEVEAPEGVQREIGGDRLSVYEGTTEFVVPFKCPPGAEEGPRRLALEVHFQPCEEGRCGVPETVEVTLPILVEIRGQAP